MVQYQNCSIRYNNSYRHLLVEIVDKTQRYKHYFITLLDLLSYCIIMYQRANVCQCLQFIAVLIKAYDKHL